MLTKYTELVTNGTQQYAHIRLPVPSGAGSWQVFAGFLVDDEEYESRQPSSDDIRNRIEEARLQERFETLAEWWHNATDALSSPSRIYAHPAYRRMVEMDRQAIPWMLADLRDRDGEWFHALQQITGLSLLSDDDEGDFEAARSAWLKWGQRQGYIE